MKLLLVTLLGLFASSVLSDCTNNGCYNELEAGSEFHLDCGQLACNVLELDGTNNILQRQGIDPVGTGSCEIEIRVQGDRGVADLFPNDENTATIHHTGDMTCESVSIGVSLSGPSGSVTCSSDSQSFSTVEGNFQAWCGNELPDNRVSGGTISGSCLSSYISCYGWTQASEFGKEDSYEDNPTCFGTCF